VADSRGRVNIGRDTMPQSPEHEIGTAFA